MAISHKPGTVFTVPKQSMWAVNGQPTLPTSVPLGGTDFHSHFRSFTHQNRIYSINSNTTAHYSFWRFTVVPKVSKISTISVPCFGTDQAAHSRPFSISIYILMHNFNTSSPLIFLGSHGLSQVSKEFSIIRSHVLGPINNPFPAFSHLKHAFLCKIFTI